MKRSLRIDRLARKEERATIRRIISLTIISVVLGAIFFGLGIPFLGRSADFIGGVFHRNESASEDAPLPPVLDDLPDATNSAKLTVGGFSSGGKTVEIFLDGEKVGAVDISDNNFKYEDLRLEEGDNNVYAKSVSESGKISDSSQSMVVVFDTKEPKLEIENPTEGQNFLANNRIRVNGTTDGDSQIYANGFLASTNPEGKFEVFVPVLEGETTIEIVALDPAGNKKVEKRKVNFKK
ncbi:MAG: hypothetical protein Q8P25_01520 [Candidatus Curtissbacteria bacterium]|nr:hypothetical protein [Candidatus Curtissbacteria bacterium]